MTDTRHGHVNWRLPTNSDSTVPNETVTHALLMDLRDELKALNRVFGCSNFQSIPNLLRDIRQAVGSHWCARCRRGFATRQGLRQHTARMHQ